VYASENGLENSVLVVVPEMSTARVFTPTSTYVVNPSVPTPITEMESDPNSR
jgi:hypothetical protein